MSAQPRQDMDRPVELNWRTLGKLLTFMRPYATLFLRLGAIMLLFAVLDSAIPLFTRAAIDRFAVPRRTDGLLGFAILCGVLALGRGLAVWCMIVTGGRVYAGISCAVRRRCFAHLQTLSFAYFDRNSVGWIMARLTSDTQQLVRLFAWGVVDLVDSFGKIAIIVVVMLVLDLRLALVVLGIVPPVIYLICRFQAISLDRFRTVRRANSDLTAAANEGIMGARTTKTLTREDANLREFTRLADTMRSASVRAACVSGLYVPLVLIVAAVGTSAALWAGGEGIVAGRITYGTLVAFIAYSVAFFEPMKELARRFPMLQSAQAAGERIFALLETEADIRDQTLGNIPTPLEFRGKVEMDHVSFEYTPGEPVLQDVCLLVQPGETVALVGDTGAGKTTLANLVCRFYDPTAGVMRIDDVDCRRLPLAWLRKRLGIVLQTPHLFSGSVAENIRYGRLDASDDELREAARMARAEHFIRNLPGGYEFDVGENGDRLSTGQKQLISLARIILASPGLLVLDEATSAVDTETEQLIQEAIEAALENRTSFVIAHRLSTIRRADRILLMKDGRILEQGTHRELIRARGAYYELYSSQFLEEGRTRVLRGPAP